MADLNKLAQPAVTPLLAKADKNLDDLYTELGGRLKEIQREPSTAGGFAPTTPIVIETLGALDDLKDFGKRFFNRMNRQAYELVCGNDPEIGKERKDLLTALGLKDRGMATAALAALLVSQLGMAALVAAALAAVVMRLVFDPAYNALCETWKSKLPAA